MIVGNVSKRIHDQSKSPPSLDIRSQTSTSKGANFSVLDNGEDIDQGHTSGREETYEGAYRYLYYITDP